MSYGHAERTLATIRLLEAETAELLHSLPRLDAEQSGWLQEFTETRQPAVIPRPAGSRNRPRVFGQVRESALDDSERDEPGYLPAEPRALGSLDDLGDVLVGLRGLFGQAAC